MIVVDFETTGLPRGGNDYMVQPGIVQIGAVKIDDTGIGDVFQSLVNPEKTDWSERAIEIHGITPERVAREPTFFEVFKGFAEFCRGSETWIGYNNKFDRDILHWQLQRYGFERNFPWPLKEVDVMQIARRKLAGAGKRGNKQWKLIDAYKEVFGKSFEGAHDALGDCKATAELFIEWNKC
tara:strand:- start:109 stop:651 length:543 start_codon:yes stop_codon:yes gene_type:complete